MVSFRSRRKEAPPPPLGPAPPYRPEPSYALTEPTSAWQRPPVWQSTAAEPAFPATVADGTLGSTRVPQIVVGAAGPAVEPLPPDLRHHTLTFRPDVVIDGWSSDALTMRGVSQRGHLHRYNGAPRQDDFAVHRLSDGRVVIVVADGVSASPQSHIGAAVAVKQAADWLRSNIGADLASLDWNALMRHAAYALTVSTQTLFGLPAPDPVRAEEELATTLVCVVIEPASGGVLRAHLVGVGDSGAWLVSADRFASVLGGKRPADSGVASSAVAALPRVPNHLEAAVVDVGPDEVLLIGTDGIGDPLGTGEGAVGRLILDVVMRPCPPSLIEFAHAVDFSRENFDDDRTLVAVWPRRSES
jgi:serine/threonine protein phosphatase PrpC